VSIVHLLNRNILSHLLCRLLPRDAMRNGPCRRAVSVRPSVCLSVRPSRSCIEASKRIFKLFHRLVAPPLHFFLHFDGGVDGIRNMKESRFSTNISLYIGSDTRYGHSRLQRLNLITLELRRLHIDLVWC